MRNWMYILPLLICSCNAKDKVVDDSKSAASIQNEIMSPVALVTWSEQVNHQTKTQQIGEHTYTLTHVSPEYLAIHELGAEATSKQIDSLKSDYSQMEYFKLKIEVAEFSDELLKYNLESATQYDERVRYCSFGISNDLSMVCGEQTVKCGLNQFERAFNAAPFVTVMLAFPKTDSKKDVTVVFDDHLFNKGLIRFTYAAEEFCAFPKLGEE